jgi:hypothetical protein
MITDSKFQERRFHNKLVNASEAELEDRSLIPPKLDFSEELKQLYTSDSNYHARLTRGFWYFSKLTQAVQTQLEKPSGSSSYFRFGEIYPQNIIVIQPHSYSNPEKLEITRVAYTDEKKYHNELRNGEIIKKMPLQNIRGNPYVPSWFPSMRRDIELKKIAPISTDSSIRYKCNYSFFDIYRAIINKGDWIVIKQINRNRSYLFEIVEVDSKQIIEIKEIPINSSQTRELRFDYNNGEEFNRCIYYQKLDSCRYYLHMLGIYLYNIFFLGLSEENYPEVSNQVFNEIQNIQYFANLDDKKTEITFSSIENSKEESLTKQLQQIQKNLALIYCKLTFADAEKSYYRCAPNNDSKRIKSVLNDLDELIVPKIISVLKLSGRAELTSYMSNEDLKNCSKVLDFSPEERKKVFLPFHKLVFDSVRVNGSSCGGNKKEIEEQKLRIENQRQELNSKTQIIENQQQRWQKTIVIAPIVALLCGLLVGFFIWGNNENSTNDPASSIENNSPRL